MITTRRRLPSACWVIGTLYGRPGAFPAGRRSYARIVTIPSRASVLLDLPREHRRTDDAGVVAELRPDPTAGLAPGSPEDVGAHRVSGRSDQQLAVAGGGASSDHDDLGVEDVDDVGETDAQQTPDLLQYIAR